MYIAQHLGSFCLTNLSITSVSKLARMMLVTENVVPWFLCTVYTHWIPWHKLLPPPDTCTCMLLAYWRCNAHIMSCTYMYMKTTFVGKCLVTDRMFFEMWVGISSGDIYSVMRSRLRRWHFGLWCVLNWAYEAPPHSGRLHLQDVVHLPGGYWCSGMWWNWGNRKVVPTASHWCHYIARAHHAKEYTLWHTTSICFLMLLWLTIEVSSKQQRRGH